MAKLETTLAAVNGGQEVAVLVSKTDWFEFDKAGKRTSDKPVGMKLSMALQGNRLAPLAVKIAGDDPLPNVSDENIAAACASGQYLYVKPVLCKVGLYNMNGQIGMTATATGAELLDTTKGKQ